MERKESTSLKQPYSNQTHIQLNCFPHSSISPHAHVTIAIHSLFCSPRNGHYHSEGHDRDRINNNQKHEYDHDINVSSGSNIQIGSQFRINAIVTGIGAGVPHYSTPVASVASSKLERVNYQEQQQTLTLRPQITATHTCQWTRGNILTLPIRYRDVQRDACIQLQLVTNRDLLIHQVSFSLWDQKGRFKTGLQRIQFDPSKADDSDGDDPTTANATFEEHEHGSKTMHRGSQEIMSSVSSDSPNTQKDEKWEASLILDQLYNLQHSKSAKTSVEPISNPVSVPLAAQSKALPNQARKKPSEVKGNTPKLEAVPWLDQYTTQRCIDILQEDISTMEHGTTLDLLDEDSFAHLIIELPDCDMPIVHQEILYTGGGMHGASGSVTALDLSLYHHEQQQLSNSTPRGGRVLMPDPQKANIQDDSNDMNYRLVQFLDTECADDNPVEDKYRTLQHELIRGLVDPALKPDASERSKLNAIISGTSQHLTREEKDLLWKFRFSLVDNRRALTKFLLAVEWHVESEVVQAAELLEQWRKRSPIEVSDALKLLGKNVAFQTGLVRAYAIDTLAAAPDAELELYLLQLVQALKYEHNDDEASISRGSKRRAKFRAENKGAGTSSLGEFLIERAAGNIQLANYLYWYLRVEREDATFGARYRDAFEALEVKLSKVPYQSTSSEQRSMWDILSAQDEFITSILECQKESFHVKGKKDAKELHLRNALKSPTCRTIKNGWDVPLPSAPHIWVTGVKAETARMFKSAMYPALLEFQKSDSTDAVPSIYKVIVKTGDDLRQDQLVIMLIKLFDRILKRGALDLCLRPYPILAMSAVEQTGLVEFVEGSIPISQILANHNNSIMSYFKSVASQEGAKYGVDPIVLQTYIRSCAGYCVITYLIGVGDRHL